ncbi:two-component system response regulator GlnR [Luteococcus sediminum]|uniref:winged helix-turn-helix domain-containing protein n=1 Tax=Luteococcus sp. TaxID=1969402 RepID=UPI0037354983
MRIAHLHRAGAPPLPASFGLLDHEVVAIADPTVELPAGCVLVLVDARADLAGAKEACTQLQLLQEPAPVLLLVDDDALGLLGPSWGADDFVLAEARPQELEARIRMALREGEPSHLVRSGPVSIDEQAYTATLGGQALDLTYTEFELLKYLALHPGRVMTREHLLSEVWGYDYYGGTRTVDVHIRRLRAKLGPEYDAHIVTVRNVGYRFLATR